ncbi:MAG: HAMP domain-containing protein [Rickettsiaceae bacterium]|nr:HAMP domain-containing protein [Rickettsiaceae bacterium]
MQNILRFKDKFNYLLFALLVCGIIYNIFYLYIGFTTDNLSLMIRHLLVTLTITLVIVLMFLAELVPNLSYFFFGSKQKVPKLKRRIVLSFTLGAALPSILIAIFGAYFFSIGIEAWFDKKIIKILNQSVSVGTSYISEHKLQLRETAISVANDLNSMYYDLVNDSQVFDRVLNAQSRLRAFDEAIVFQKSSNTVLAQTALSFSLSFIPIQPNLIERARSGDIVEIDSGNTKIRVLLKLEDFDDTFLLIGRLVDPQIINHIHEVNGAVAEYNSLKKHITALQEKFSLIFIILSALLLISAVIWGRKFAKKIVQPITELIKAAERVKNGDLTAQVPLESLKKDEIRVLSSAFNRMVNQLDVQQKELGAAQRAMAWSDVARRVAHEIKNPLTPIQLSAERILTKYSVEIEDKVSFSKYVNNIIKHSNDIKNIVSEFVEFARLPAPNFKRHELYSLIKDLVDSRRLINHNINYIFDANVNQCYMVCDIAQINRVLVNLLLNAEESLAARANDKIIILKLKAAPKEVEISVSDNGSGFSEEMLKHAKEAYITTKNSGTGLGLSIVNRIITDHFGELFINNDEILKGGQVKLILDTQLLIKQLK